ncbi:MAG: TetR/AcrR family transcriptional regulator [Microbacteriaceae bacterium]
MTGPHPQTASSRERIVDAATRLFAERGYDATSTRSISDAVGLNLATVAYHVGSKSDLYREVMHQAHTAQRDLLAGALDDLRAAGSTEAEARAALSRFVDAYLDFCVVHPHIPALWMRRWLSEGADAAELEAEYAQPLAAAASDAVQGVLTRSGLAMHVDVQLLVWTIVWTCHSFCQSGVIDADGGRHGANDSVMLARFRAHLHVLVDRLVTPVVGP